MHRWGCRIGLKRRGTEGESSGLFANGLQIPEVLTGGGGSAPPPMCVDTCDELFAITRLANEIVGPKLDADNPTRCRVLGAHEDDRHSIAQSLPDLVT